MENFIDIQIVGIDMFDDTLHLLELFFHEEGFKTPSEMMRTSLQAMISDPGSAVFVAQHEGKVIGVATVTTTVGIEYGRSAEIDDLYVLPASRGLGIASALIDEVCNWCYREGVTAVLVTVTPEGDAKHNLLDYYRRHGFENRGRVILERFLEDKDRE